MDLLTRKPEVVQNADMSKRVRKLLDEAKRWCAEERGRQAQLAKQLGVAKQSVNVWFAEYLKDHPKNAPTAEQALELAAFLKSQARKQKPK